MSPDEGSLPPTAGANPGPGPSPGWRVVGDAVRAASEVFGPKITAEAVSSDAEAVGRANGSAGGLAGYVSGEDFATAQAVREQLDAGEVKINVTSVVDMSSESAQSFRQQRNWGHGERDLLDVHSGKQVIGRDLIDPPL